MLGPPGFLGAFRSRSLGLGPAQDPKNMRIGVTSVRFTVRVKGLVLGPPGPLGAFRSPSLGLGSAQDPKNMRIGVTSVRFRVRVGVRGLVLLVLGPWAPRGL